MKKIVTICLAIALACFSLNVHANAFDFVLGGGYTPVDTEEEKFGKNEKGENTYNGKTFREIAREVNRKQAEIDYQEKPEVPVEVPEVTTEPWIKLAASLAFCKNAIHIAYKNQPDVILVKIKKTEFLHNKTKSVWMKLKMNDIPRNPSVENCGSVLPEGFAF